VPDMADAPAPELRPSFFTFDERGAVIRVAIDDKTPIDVLITGSSGSAFIEEVGQLLNRIDRLEKITRLFLAPVLPYAHALTPEAFTRYLDDRCPCSGREAEGEREPEWFKGNYTGYYTHRKTRVEVDISGWDADKKLLDALLMIAAAEGRMPSRVLADIQPDAFPSAVDHLATLVDEEVEEVE